MCESRKPPGWTKIKIFDRGGLIRKKIEDNVRCSLPDSPLFRKTSGIYRNEHGKKQHTWNISRERMKCNMPWTQERKTKNIIYVIYVRIRTIAEQKEKKNFNQSECVTHTHTALAF